MSISCYPSITTVDVRDARVQEGRHTVSYGLRETTNFCAWRNANHTLAFPHPNLKQQPSCQVFLLEMDRSTLGITGGS